MNAPPTALVHHDFVGNVVLFQLVNERVYHRRAVRRRLVVRIVIRLGKRHPECALRNAVSPSVETS